MRDCTKFIQKYFEGASQLHQKDETKPVGVFITLVSISANGVVSYVGNPPINVRLKCFIA